MRQRHKAVHSLKITPKRFVRVYSKNISYEHHAYKYGKSNGKRVPFWPVCLVGYSQREIKKERKLNSHTEKKCFAGDKREKHIHRRHKSDYRQSENQVFDDIFYNLIHRHTL